MARERKSRYKATAARPTNIQKRSGTALKCPECARTFLIGPAFVMDVVATCRVRSSKRAEVHCEICGYTWWSEHPEALRKARAMLRARRKTQ